MGLYDTFEVVFTCPRCGFRKNEDYQTKEAGNSLHYYKLGKKAEWTTYDKTITHKLNDGIFIVYLDSVHICNGKWTKMWVEGKAHIEGGIYTKTDSFKLSEITLLKLVECRNNEHGYNIKIFETPDGRRSVCRTNELPK